MADRSDRYEEYDVNFVGKYAVHQGRDEVFYDSSGAIDAPHEGVRVGADGSERVFVDHGAQLFDREDDVDVFSGVGEVVREMGGSKIGRVNVCWDGPVTRVVFEVESSLTFDIDTTGADKP